jgi:hypothetical protein
MTSVVILKTPKHILFPVIARLACRFFDHHTHIKAVAKDVPTCPRQNYLSKSVI